eukprot:6705830-Pyramimonas_sp.AAC.1
MIWASCGPRGTPLGGLLGRLGGKATVHPSGPTGTLLGPERAPRRALKGPFSAALACPPPPSNAPALRDPRVVLLPSY